LADEKGNKRRMVPTTIRPKNPAANTCDGDQFLNNNKPFQVVLSILHREWNNTTTRYGTESRILNWMILNRILNWQSLDWITPSMIISNL